MNLKKIFSSVLATVLTVSAFAIGGATPAMAASTGISPGNTYAFQSTANTNYALNIFGTSTSQITNNRNVCLYQYDSNDIMQQWKVVSTSGGYRLQAAGGAVGYYLDRLSYGATSSNPLNNAQTYTASEDSIVNFESTNVENWVKIYQNVNGTRYYLTAVNCTNGTADGKSSTSPGNVYWAPESYSQSFQTWKVVPIGGGSSNGQKLRLPVSGNNVISASMVKTTESAYYSWYRVYHYGADISLADGTALYGLGNGTVISRGWNNAEGNFIIVRYNNCIPVNGGAAKDIIVRYFHMNSVSASVGANVTTGTLLGYSGHTGDYAYGADHLHMEFDTDTVYPGATPSLTSSAAGGGLTAGVRGSGDTTVNPFDWMYNYSGQTKSSAGFTNEGYNYTLSSDLTTHTP